MDWFLYDRDLYYYRILTVNCFWKKNPLYMFDKIPNTFPEISKRQVHFMKCTLNFHVHLHCVKYRNFIYFSGVEILWKGTVSA